MFGDWHFFFPPTLSQKKWRVRGGAPTWEFFFSHTRFFKKTTFLTLSFVSWGRKIWLFWEKLSRIFLKNLFAFKLFLKILRKGPPPPARIPPVILNVCTQHFQNVCGAVGNFFSYFFFFWPKFVSVKRGVFKTPVLAVR